MKLSEMFVDPILAAFFACSESGGAPGIREIVVERLFDPAGWFLVEMSDEAGNELFARVWECEELAVCDAEAMKEVWGPAVIRYKSGMP
ncbi:hypothetical protein [Mesorhizobium sp. WSM3626]|uniref:hypothetical protein n=1 Tax=Mesorhizobium sp. WSM3626 TaxID=1040987 RepID=UPI000481544D|nr:hypothetical protein [Mesorhizobium sp. WSM3626]